MIRSAVFISNDPYKIPLNNGLTCIHTYTQLVLSLDVELNESY